ncbi:MAG: hypothetical protein ACJ78Q_00185 [Chloroflexia bacterium]
MYRRLRPAWALVLMIAVLVAQATPAAAKTSYFYDFEKGTKPWTVGSTGSDLERSLSIQRTENGCPSTTDTSHAFVKFVNVAGKPSAAWVVTSFATVSTGADLVRMTYCQKTADLCAGCKPIIYVGGDMPVSLSQFQSAYPSITEPPVVGDWMMYQFPSPNGPEPTIYNKGTVYVAIGVAGPSVKENTTEGFGLDCIDLTIFPAP